jgi:hypothetical protein
LEKILPVSGNFLLTGIYGVQEFPLTVKTGHAVRR